MSIYFSLVWWQPPSQKLLKNWGALANSVMVSYVTLNHFSYFLTKVFILWWYNKLFQNCALSLISHIVRLSHARWWTPYADLGLHRHARKKKLEKIIFPSWSQLLFYRNQLNRLPYLILLESYAGAHHTECLAVARAQFQITICASEPISVI